MNYAGIIVGGEINGARLEGEQRRMWTPAGWHIWTPIAGAAAHLGFWRPEDLTAVEAWKMLLDGYPTRKGLPPI